MKILLDHNVPRHDKTFVREQGFDCHAAFELGWDGHSNGKLLAAAESGGFTILLTLDKDFLTEHKSATRTIAILVLTPKTQSKTDFREVVSAAVGLFSSLTPGEVRKISPP